MTALQRVYFRRFWYWIAAYVVTLLAVTFLVPRPPQPDAIHVAAAILPLVPLFLALYQTYSGIRAMDELQRRIHVEGLLLSLIGTTAIVLGVGLLQMIAGIPAFGVFWLFVPICVLYALGACLASRRYSC
jgi:hypothetical protein